MLCEFPTFYLPVVVNQHPYTRMHQVDSGPDGVSGTCTYRRVPQARMKMLVFGVASCFDFTIYLPDFIVMYVLAIRSNSCENNNVGVGNVDRVS